MSILASGRIFSLCVLLIYGLLMYYYNSLAKMGNLKANLRPIPALDVIPDAIGRATETDRPVLISVSGNLMSDEAPAVIAAYTISRYVAQICAEKGAELYCMVSRADQVPVAEQNVLEGFRMGGAPELFKPENIRFTPGWGFTSHVMGTLERENVATQFLLGSLYSGLLHLTEVGSRVGVLSIGGSTQPINLPVLAATADYCLIAEEELIAGPYLYKDDIQLAAIRAEDIIKIIGASFGAVGVIMSLAGIQVLLDILSI